MKSPRLRRWLGISLVALGLALVGLTVAYYAYSAYAETQLGRMNQSQPLPPVPSPETPLQGQPSTPTPAPETPPLGQPSTPTPGVGEPSLPLPTAIPSPIPTPKPLPPQPAERIVIPAIGVNSRVVEIGATREGDGPWVWERPVFSVGHVRWSANPGEGSNIVMAGHISSPIEGEGEVFKRLPEIPDILAQKKPVDVILYTAQGRYVYRVTKTMVVEPDDSWVMDPTPDETVTLITCVPDYVYSQRLIIVAKPLPGMPDFGERKP
ncbi:MAG: sortase [Chloroflexota bacterium]|nr:sortase [Chloroflexota bacterium]